MIMIPASKSQYAKWNQVAVDWGSAAIARELYKLYFILTPKSEKKSMNKPKPKSQFFGMNGSPESIEIIMETRGVYMGQLKP